MLFWKNYIGVGAYKCSRVWMVWVLRLLYRIGYIFAWTILYAVFLDSFGIQYLPYLLFFDALLVLIGSFFANYLFLHIKNNVFLIGAIIGSIACVILSYIFRDNGALFFLFGFLTKNFFFFQISIGISEKIESLFSPKEAQKIVPILDSAVTIGTIIASIIFLQLLSILPTKDILLFWIIPLVLMSGIILFEKKIIHYIPKISWKDNKVLHGETQDIVTKFWPSLKNIIKTPFLRLMLLFVFVQSALFGAMDFVFLDHVNKNAVQREDHFSFNPNDHFSAAPPSFSMQASLFNVPLSEIRDTMESVAHKTKEVSKNFFAHSSVAHDLGIISLIVGIVSLLIQFFLASRLLERIGIVSSIMTYFAGFFSVLVGSLFLGGSPNLIRGYAHGFYSLLETGYHVTFYAILSSDRPQIRHIMEGFVRPLGVIVSMGILMIIMNFVNLQQYSEILFMGTTIGIVLILWYMKQNFTLFSNTTLESTSNIKSLFHSIEILSQKGHPNAVEILCKKLLSTNSNMFVRKKIIRGLTQLNNPQTIHTYNTILSNPKESNDIKVEVLNSLTLMSSLKKYWEDHSFSQHLFLEILEKSFVKEKSDYIQKLLLINIFRHLPVDRVVPFFFKTINSQNEHIRSVCLRSSAEAFHDPALVHYIQRFLNNKNTKVKGHAIIALWNFYDKDALRNVLSELMESTNVRDRVSALYTVGEVRDKGFIKNILQLVHDKDKEIALHALVALAKMEYKPVVGALINMMMDCNDIHRSHRLSQMLSRISPAMRTLVKKELEYHVSGKVVEIILPYQSGGISKINIPTGLRAYLKHLYFLTERYDDMLLME